MKLEHIPQHCPICKRRFMNILGQPLPNHAQVRCSTTKGNQLDIGVCQECSMTGITVDTTNAILDGIKDFWIMELETNQNMTEDERAQRIAYHNSHVIEGIIQVLDTGAEAQTNAEETGTIS